MCRKNAYESYLIRAKSLGPVERDEAGYIIGGHLKHMTRGDMRAIKRILKKTSEFNEDSIGKG